VGSVDLIINIGLAIGGAVVGVALDRWLGRNDVAKLRQAIGPEVLQALSTWSEQGRLNVEKDPRTGEIRSVSGTGNLTLPVPKIHAVGTVTPPVAESAPE
jgi:hypothetical protein